MPGLTLNCQCAGQGRGGLGQCSSRTCQRHFNRLQLIDPLRQRLRHAVQIVGAFLHLALDRLAVIKGVSGGQRGRTRCDGFLRTFIRLRQILGAGLDLDLDFMALFERLRQRDGRHRRYRAVGGRPGGRGAC